MDVGGLANSLFFHRLEKARPPKPRTHLASDLFSINAF